MKSILKLGKNIGGCQMVKKAKVIEPYKVWDKFFECSCHSEGILVGAEWYKELDDSELYHPEITVAYWEEGFYTGKKLGLKQKLRYMWHVLVTGKPWNDMVVLDTATARKLGEHLIAFSKKQPKKKKKKLTQ